MGTTAVGLDDGNMNDINEENTTPEENEPNESIDELVDAVTDADADADATDDVDDTDVVDDTTELTDTTELADTDEIDEAHAELDFGDAADRDDTIESTPDETADMGNIDFASEAEPAFADETVADEPMDAPYVPPAPAAAPPPLEVAQYERLTRDPTATFGGVLSGIAHRYGWDVALTRLAFIVLLIISGGTAILAYFLSWIVIPRATHWPPPRVQVSRGRLSARDLGVGLIGLGALVILGIGSGQAAAVLVPLALVGGGIWLLLQNPREEGALAAAGAQPTATYYAAQPAPAASAAPAGTYAAPMASAPMSPPIAPAPAPKRSRFRRVGFVGLFGLLTMILLAIIAVPLILFAAVFGGDIDFDGGQTYVFSPSNVDDIPTIIREDAGEIVLDLTAVDFSSIGPDDDPLQVDVDLDFGSIKVRLPDDVRVDVDAEGDIAGDVTVFGSSSDGFGPARVFSDDDPQLELELEVNLGEIVVTRGGSSSTTTVEIN